MSLEENKVRLNSFERNEKMKEFITERMADLTESLRTSFNIIETQSKTLGVGIKTARLKLEKGNFDDC